MSLPVNKKTLDYIVSEKLKTNSTQAITASELRNSLYPIINSAFALKTIWAGTIYTAYSSTARTEHWIAESYYDPNYFDPLQTNPSVGNSDNNKYQVLTPGYNLRNNVNESTFNFTNVGVTWDSTSTGNMSKSGGMLTFDGSVTAGVLTSLSVNNPGFGYVHGSATSTVLKLNIANLSGASPTIKFNLYNTVWIAETVKQNSNSFDGNRINVFIPFLNVPEGGLQQPQTIPTPFTNQGIQLCYTDAGAYNSGISRITPAQSYLADGNYTYPGVRPGSHNGFYFDQVTNYSSSNHIARGFLEIKVPVTWYTTNI